MPKLPMINLITKITKTKTEIKITYINNNKKYKIK